jgi:hypothetical protein
MSTNAELYAQDFYAWTQTQATVLTARDVDALDFEPLVEEIPSLGISERHALGSHSAAAVRIRFVTVPLQ